MKRKKMTAVLLSIALAFSAFPAMNAEAENQKGGSETAAGQESFTIKRSDGRYQESEKESIADTEEKDWKEKRSETDKKKPEVKSEETGGQETEPETKSEETGGQEIEPETKSEETGGQETEPETKSEETGGQETEPETKGEETESGETEKKELLVEISRAVEAALAQEIPDLDSSEMQKFLEASAQYDKMEETETKELPRDVREGIRTVRERIRDEISLCKGIRAEGCPWYVKIEVTDLKETEEIEKKLQEQSGGREALLVEGKEISYYDIRSKAVYQNAGTVSLVWTKPKGYDKLQNPQVYTFAQGKLALRETEEKEDTLFLKNAQEIHQLVLADIRDTESGRPAETSVSKAMEETKAYMLRADPSPSVGSEWFVLGLARGGMDLGASYFSVFYNHFANYLEEKKGILTNTVRYTEYSKAILCMTALGKDARNLAGYNLFKPLADFETVTAQGTNGAIWALIALHANPSYSLVEDRSVRVLTTEERLLSYVLKRELPGGGWSLSGQKADADLTGMALQALAYYYGKSGYEQATAAADRALQALSKMQNPDGGYSSGGQETLESVAQVVVGLCALGIHPETDGRFLKDGHGTIENLLSYHISGGGFMHERVKESGDTKPKANGMATEQGYYALAAYQRFQNGQTALYDMSDLQIDAGQRGDGGGAGLPKPPDKKKPGKKPKDDPDQKPKVQTPPKGKTVVLKKVSKKKASGKASSAKKKSKKDSQKEEAGWDFEAESYPGEAKEEPITMAQKKAGMAGEREKSGRLPHIPLWLWSLAAGIILGAAAKGQWDIFRRKDR